MPAWRARAAAGAARLLIGVGRALGGFAGSDRAGRIATQHRLDRLLVQQKTENLRFQTALDNMTHGLCFFDGDSRLIVCNRQYARMYGLSADLCAAGTPLREIVEHRFRVGAGPKIGPTEYLSWRASIAAFDAPSATVSELADGRIFAIHHQPMPDGGWVATHEDITERRRAEAQIARMAHHDALTGLPNRVMFAERLEAGVRHGAAGACVAVLTVDLDGFKAVNDSLGHPVGDTLLQVVAQRLSECLREHDLVARLGGDEFAVIQSGGQQPEAVRALGERIVRVIAEPFEIADHRVSIGASVGAALADAHDVGDAEGVLKRADLALYESKSDGRGRFSMFTSSMGDRARERQALEADLRLALGRGEFELHYQPLVRTGRPGLEGLCVCGFEALLRWNHPVRGLVMPDRFIAVAEEIGVIAEIGAWVLQAATAEAARWPGDVAVAINLSPLQFAAPIDLVGQVRAALRDSGLAAGRVELEITESVRLAESAANLTTLHRLRGLGVRVCLDDFGVGYSSLSYLRSFPFHKIKIDRSFVHDMAGHRDAAAIVRAITSLGHSLGMSVTAEGVESAYQSGCLEELGCDELQGYHFGRPAPAGDVPAVLQALNQRFAPITGLRVVSLSAGR